MIQSHDDKNDRESMSMPLLFTSYSYDNYLQSSKSFQEGFTGWRIFFSFQKPTKYGQVMFCEAVKVNIWQIPRTHHSTTQ
jgi:hypothetical protein